MNIVNFQFDESYDYYLVITMASQDSSASLPAPKTMIKLHLEIQLVKLKYRRRHPEPHFIIFSVEGQDNEYIHHEQRFLQKNEINVTLEKMIPLPLYLIIGPEKTTACPFHIKFTSKFKEPVQRIMSILQGVILNHYLKHDIFEEIKPLQQTYLFQGGSLSYLIHLRPQILEDRDDVRKYRRLFKKLSKPGGKDSQKSNSPLKPKQVGSFQYLRSNVAVEDDQVQMPPNEPVLHSNTSLHAMSVEEIAEKLQQKTKNEYKQHSALSVPKSGNFLHKMGRNGSLTMIDELQLNARFKMKVTVILIFIGLFGFLITALFNPRTEEVFRKKTKRPTRAKR